MRPLRYSINVTLDGCCDHEAMPADEELHRYAAANLDRADALLFGRVTYQMMESAFKLSPGQQSDDPFANTIDAAKKYVVSTTIGSVDWNAELIKTDLRTAVEQLKAQPGKGIATGGLQLPRELARLGLIDEYEFIVHPRIAGHGPTLFAGLPHLLDLRLVDRQELQSGAIASTYEPKTEL